MSLNFGLIKFGYHFTDNYKKSLKIPMKKQKPDQDSNNFNDEQQAYSQEVLFKINFLEQQIQQLQLQFEAVEKEISELNFMALGMNELIGSTGKEIFASIGKGIFTKAKIISEELLVDVGGKNFVKKNISETKKMIETQIGKLNEVKEELNRLIKSAEGEFKKAILEIERKNR